MNKNCAPIALNLSDFLAALEAAPVSFFWAQIGGLKGSETGRAYL
jgi:hypothetical protein